MDVLLAVVLEADVRSHLRLCGTHGKGHGEPEPALGRAAPPAASRRRRMGEEGSLPAPQSARHCSPCEGQAPL